MNTENIIDISQKLHELQDALFVLNKEDSTPQTRSLIRLIHQAIQKWEIR